MERLTKKNRNYFELYDEEVDDLLLGECYEKLQQYEDVEEKYGIDLLTLIKAVENGFFYYNYNSFNRITKAESFLSIIDFESNRLIYDECKSFHFEDYGKEWALTKEELK